MKNTVKTNKIELTEKELVVLIAITNSDFYEYENASVWDYSVLDYLPFSGKIRSGVISSLEQKDLLIVTKKMKGDIAGVFQMTELGYKTFLEATEVKIDAKPLAVTAPVENKENREVTKQKQPKLDNLSYQDIAKIYGPGFIGKNKQTLINSIIERSK
jgi:hypothetical protein